ncbi:MAG: HAMP domain-containing protein [Cytophagales bacterium]|nr:MAG: HAMP domain-containing protein [Cytophagales bacterium]TAF60146.1 MAG: HAMP domain-containing protein [Cytophagales bacterium]
MRFSLKIVLLCFCITLLSFSGFFWTANKEFVEATEQQIASQLEQKANYAFSGIDKFIYERFSDVLSIASEPVFVDKGSSQAQISRRLEQLKSIYPHYLSMSFFDTNRVRIADTGQKQIGVQHNLSGYWVDISNSDFAIDISYSESMQLYLMHFAFMVRDQDGLKRGVFVARLHLDKLYDTFKEVLGSKDLADNVHIDLLDEDLNVVYSNHSTTEMLKKKANLRFDSSNTRVEPRWRDAESIYFCVQQKGYKSYSGNNWNLVLSVPQKVAFADAIEMKRRLFYTLIPILLLVLLAAYLASKMITRPIKKLTHAVTDLGEGKEFGNPIEINSTDEVGKLASAFNRMVVKLKHKMQEQEQSNIKLTQLHEQALQQMKAIQTKNEQIEAQNQEIEIQQRELRGIYNEISLKNNAFKESIRYAERIQRSMLPEWQLIQDTFEGVSLFYAPRDMVGGDFYWFEHIEVEKAPHFFLAVADCTGHGVPGGFMSMLGNDLLNSIVPIEKCYKPRNILNKLNEGIKRSLHQNSNNTQSQDGLEIAVCSINLDTLKMNFASAKIPLFLFRKGELSIVQGSKLTIGGVERNFKHLAHGESPIENHQFNLKAGDVIYLFSDGYKDQFGGEMNRKYSSKRFKEFLQSIQVYDMRIQQDLIAEEFANWKGSNKQTDDVLVLGFKI